MTKSKLDIKALARNIIVIMIVVAGYVVLTNLINPLGDLDIPGAFAVLVSPFGGWLNLVLLLVEIGGFTAVVYALYRALKKHYDETNNHWLWINLGLILTGGLILALIGINWIRFPEASDWLSLIPLAGLVAAGLLVVTPRKTMSAAYTTYTGYNADNDLK